MAISLGLIVIILIVLGVLVLGVGGIIALVIYLNDKKDSRD